MRAREKGVHTAVMKMTTRGVYPGGVEFRVEGTIRVLAKGQEAGTDVGKRAGPTHVHVKLSTQFDQDVSTEWEMVKTPAGVWTRERDHSGATYTVMDRELMVELEKAAKALGQDRAMPGAVGRGEEPLGSALVAALAEQFELALTEEELEKRPCWRLKGPAKVRAEGDNRPPEPLPAASVDLFVRKADHALVRMVQFDEQGGQLVRMDIGKLEINPELATATFKIHLSGGEKFVDVMEHPPAAAQIQAMLDDAKEKLEAEAEREKAKKDEGKKGVDKRASDTRETGRSG